MADSKETALTIKIKAVDRATAVIRAVGAKVSSLAKPTVAGFKGIGVAAKGIGSAIGEALSRVGSVIGDVLDKIPLLGAAITGVVGGAVAGLVHLVDKFDDIGKAATRVGVGVDALAGLRYAAEKTGAPVEALDEGLKQFSQNLGQARAGTGRMAKFLGIVSPALLRQLKAAKDNEAAFRLLADAMAKLHDPAKRAALAQKTVGDSALAPLLARGAAGIKTLTDEHDKLTGSLNGAAAASAEAKDAMIDLHAAIDGAEAGIVVGLAPALKVIVNRLSEWFVAHRADITEWAKKIGDELPGAIGKVVDAIKSAVAWLQTAYGKASDLVDKLGGLDKWADFFSSGRKLISFGYKTSPIGLIKNDTSTDTGVRGMFRQFAERQTEAKDGLSPLDAIAQVQAAQARLAIPVPPVLRMPVAPPLTVPQSFRDRPDITPALNGAMGMFAPAAPAAPPSEAKVTVDFLNVPRGTRVKTDPKSTADVDLSVGYQMIPGTL